MSGRERKEGPDVLSDIEIAQATKPQHISAIAEKAGVPDVDMEGLSFPRGSIVGVLGDNGAGKSTFARCL